MFMAKWSTSYSLDPTRAFAVESAAFAVESAAFAVESANKPLRDEPLKSETGIPQATRQATPNAFTCLPLGTASASERRTSSSMGQFAASVQFFAW